MKKPKQKTNKRSVRHPRAIQVDRQKRPLVDNIAEDGETLFRRIVHPLTLSPCDLFRQRGFPHAPRDDGFAPERHLAASVGIGAGDDRQQRRLVEGRYGNKWHRSLTHALDPQQ